jgi:DNA-binding NarL/FixJ family response regulator
MNIFLIEDDEIYASFIKKSLIQNTSYNVTVFSASEDAVKALPPTLPDVIIVDYKLPGMTGIDFYESIKSKLNDKHKVVMLSAMDDGNMVLSFIQKGVRDYVIKDENVIESLVAIIEGKEEEYYLFN